MIRNLSLFIILAGTLKADFITSEVTCLVSSENLTASNFCDVAGDHGTSASASASASFGLPASPGPLSLTSTEQGFARGYNDRFARFASVDAYFRAFISIQLTLDTPGSLRPGLFLITGHTAAPVGADTLFSESIFGFSTSPTVPLRPLAITLGEPFTFTYMQGMACFDDGLNFSCGNNVVSSQYDFHLYEADGVTPVLITLATPEPSSATLLFLSLTGLLLAAWYQVKSEWLVKANPAPSSAPTTTSLRKCIPSKIRSVAIGGAHTSKGGSGSPAHSISARAAR
jgi:hypothetical protein